MDSRQIEERAAAWLAKRDSGAWTAQDERELNEWLNASTANTVAFIRLEAAWNAAQRLKALGAGRRRGEVPKFWAWRLSPFVEQKPALAAGATVARVRTLSRAMAATLLLALAAGIFWYAWPAGPAYHTPVGGIASVPMTDGSKVTLNTDSSIRVEVNEKERRVELEQGEAFFEVAKDPTRPFVVKAGSKRVIAVGTKFSVRRLGNDIRVFVTEGKVRIESGDSPHTPGPDTVLEKARAVSGTALVAAAGSIARTRDDGVLVQEQQLSHAEDYLSWRTGYLVFRDTVLADAVAEFNRYNEHQIVIDDAQVAGIRLSGKFRSTNFEAFVRLLEDGFPIQAIRRDEQIVLTARN
jgi:transmembrane sensor